MDEKQIADKPVTSQSKRPQKCVLPAFVGVNKRNKPYRRWKKLYLQFLNAVEQPLNRNIVETTCQRCAALTLALEAIDSDVLNGLPVNAESMSRLSNTLGRYLHSIGLLDKWNDPPKKIDPGEAMKRLKNWPIKDKPQ